MSPLFCLMYSQDSLKIHSSLNIRLYRETPHFARSFSFFCRDIFACSLPSWYDTRDMTIPESKGQKKSEIQRKLACRRILGLSDTKNSNRTPKGDL